MAARLNCPACQGWVVSPERAAAPDDSSFQRLGGEAQEAPFEGWDFSSFGDRYQVESPSWDYRRLAESQLRLLGPGAAVLDMGTGGGELLRTLHGLPRDTHATEGYPPNVLVARMALQPHAIEVDEVTNDAHLPYPDQRFDLILNRHESFDAFEVARVLRPGGVFLSQQVGGRDLAELNQQLAAPPHTYTDWTLDAATRQVTAAGLRVLDSGAELVEATFRDVGAIVRLLLITPWAVPGFPVDAYRPRLQRLHEYLNRGPLTCTRTASISLRNVLSVDQLVRVLHVPLPGELVPRPTRSDARPAGCNHRVEPPPARHPWLCGSPIADRSAAHRRATLACAATSSRPS